MINKHHMKNWTLRTCPLYQDLLGGGVKAGVKKGVKKSGKTIQNNYSRQYH